MKDKTEYPEHEKLEKVKETSQSIGEFLEWLYYEKRIHFARYSKYDVSYRVSLNTNELLAEYFGIDLTVLEQEKRQMLEELRKDSDKK